MIHSSTQAAIQAALNERRAERRPVRIQVRVRDIMSYDVVTMADISDYGCRIVSSRQPCIGRFVTLEIPSMMEISGRVAWVGGDAYGIDFSNPLRPEVVEHVTTLKD